MIDALQIWSDLVRSDRRKWAASAPALLARLREGRATYGGRDLVRALRPKFVSTGEYAELEYVCGVIMGAARRLAERILADPALQEFVALSEGERRLIAPEPLCPDPCAFARLDSFLTEDGPRFVELNGEVPAGAGFSDVLLEGFLDHPLTAEFRRRTGAYGIPTRPPLLHNLLVAWRAAGRRGAPRILITDYLDVATIGEFHILRDYFASQGFEAEVEDPRRLDYKDGRLYAKGASFDLVYRRVLTNEFLEREGELVALWSAYRDRAVVMVNPFRSKLLHKKATFALLTGERPIDWMTREERAVIGRHVPWTRRVREGRTEHAGATVDLVPHVLANRARFVVKPSDDYGGRGVVLGSLVDSATFERAISEALRGEWVVQELVRPCEEPYPLIDAGLEERPMIVDLDPYVYFGRVDGLLARLSAGAVSNVTSGGGQVPVLIVPER